MPLTSEQLFSLLADLESDRVERTISFEKTDKFSEAICAFANDMPGNQLPGYLFIGADDQGKLAGKTVTDGLLTTLASLRSSGNIVPLPRMNVQKYSFAEGELAVVEVFPADAPPVRYKGKVCIRVGPSRGTASEQEERVLTEKRRSKNLSFDSQPCIEAGLEDLALPIFEGYRQSAISSEVIQANHRSIDLQLASLRFFDLKSKRPTMAGLILFGSNPRFFLSGNYIQFLRLPGAELSEKPIDQAEISGDLLTVMRELDLRIKVNLSSQLTQISILKEEAGSEYPVEAIRELAVNAVLHRNYESSSPVRFYWFSDHIEIQNPGGLFGEVTKETLTTVNSYRNPVLAEALKELGYVNRFGYGISRAYSLLKKNGNPPPEFEITANYFLVKIFKRLQ